MSEEDPPLRLSQEQRSSGQAAAAGWGPPGNTEESDLFNPPKAPTETETTAGQGGGDGKPAAAHAPRSLVRAPLGW